MSQTKQTKKAIFYGDRRIEIDSRVADYLCRAGVARHAEDESQSKGRKRRGYSRRDMQAEGSG